MSKRFSKYIASFDYFGKSLIALSATSCCISIASFATFIGTPIGIASASPSLTFSLSAGHIITKIIKNNRSKLNSIESKISEALMNSQISHENFMKIINEERNYRELKESIRMMKGQEHKKIYID